MPEATDRPRRNPLFLAGGAVFLAIAAGALAVVGSYFLESRTVAARPLAEGRVTVSELASRPGIKGRTYWTPVVRYRYPVEGRDYESDRIHLGGWNLTDRESAEAEVARFPVGSVVKALYDPATPGDAVLETGVSWTVLLFGGGFGAVFGLLGLVLVYAGCQAGTGSREG